MVATLFHRIRREAVGGVVDERTSRLIEELLGYPDVAVAVRDVDRQKPPLPVIPIRYAKNGVGPIFNYFSAVTTLGTPQDVTLQELRIECFFPADVATEGHARAVGQ